MSLEEKQEQLDALLKPFGYFYESKQDIISSRKDAWQRTFGYTAFFDDASPHFNMVFDSLPIYFDYGQRTWLIEFWKGQYGINTGAEIGIYYADDIVSEKDRSEELFQAVNDKDMLPVQFELRRNNTALASVSGTTWWLTSFCMGVFSQPKDLTLRLAITFPNCGMLHNFLAALLNTGIDERNVTVSGHQIYVLFSSSPLQNYTLWARFFRRLAQISNGLFCKLFLLLTRPFTTTIDRLLYLYYLLPFTRSRFLSPRKYKRCYSKHKCAK